MAVQSLAVWPKHSPIHLHEVDEASGVLSQAPGDKDDLVPRRHAYHASVQGAPSGAASSSSEIANGLRVSPQPQEERVPIQPDGVLGFHIDSTKTVISLPQPKLHSFTKLAKNMAV